MKEILINDGFLHASAAILNSGVLEDFFVEHGQEQGSVGNIYKGTIDNVVTGMQSAFVNIGLEKNAFLFLDDIIPPAGSTEKDIRKLVKKGQDILVQITKEAQGVKGARVTTEITLPGRNLVLMPRMNYVGVSKRIAGNEEKNRLREILERIRPADCGCIVRTEAAGATEEQLLEELDFLLEKWTAICAAAKVRNAPAVLHREDDLLSTILREYLDVSVEKVIINSRSAFETATKIAAVITPGLCGRIQYCEGDLYANRGLESALRKLLQRRVWLDNGAYLMIDYTEALTAIDVNTGKFTGDYDMNKTILQTNLLAAREIARQLRLRAIGGIIVIDFIDMENEDDRSKVIAELETASAGDKVRTNIIGFAPLGLVEMTRKKSRLSLASAMQCECPYCEGDGRILQDDTVLNELFSELGRTFARTGSEKAVLRVHPRIAAAMEPHKALLAERFPGKSLFVREDPGMHMEDYNTTVFPAGDEMASTEGLKRIL